MTEITEILDIYENKGNEGLVLGLKDGNPRTSHSTVSIPATPNRHLSQKEVRKNLFDDNADGYIIYHASDLDQVSEDNCASSPSISSQGEAATITSNTSISMRAADHSLTRVIAHHIYGNEDLFDKVEDEIMKYEYEYATSSSLNFGSIHHHEIRPLLQTVSNIYSLDIHFYKAGKSTKVREIISPIDSWSLKEKVYPLHIIQKAVNHCAFKKIGFKEVFVKEEKSETQWRQAVVDGFMKAQNWTEKDERIRSLIIQGTSSIEDLNSVFHEMKNEEGSQEVEMQNDVPEVTDLTLSKSRAVKLQLHTA